MVRCSQPMQAVCIFKYFLYSHSQSQFLIMSSTRVNTSQGTLHLSLGLGVLRTLSVSSSSGPLSLGLYISRLSQSSSRSSSTSRICSRDTWSKPNPTCIHNIINQTHQCKNCITNITKQQLFFLMMHYIIYLLFEKTFAYASWKFLQHMALRLIQF